MVSGVTVPSGMAVSATIAEDEGTTSVLSVTDDGVEAVGERLDKRQDLCAGHGLAELF